MYSPQFPSVCDSTDFSKEYYNTEEIVYYQKITDTNVINVITNPNNILIDNVVLVESNGVYFKAIYNENTINIEWYLCLYPQIPQNEEDREMKEPLKQLDIWVLF